MTFQTPWWWFDVGLFVEDLTAGCGRVFAVGVFFGYIVAQIYYDFEHVEFGVFHQGANRKSQRGNTLVRLAVRWTGIA